MLCIKGEYMLIFFIYINSFVWGLFLFVLLVGIGIYLLFCLGFI